MSISRSQAIRFRCLDCMCGSANEVKKCESQDCSLWEYRLGGKPSAAKNTLRNKDVKILGQPDKRVLSDEELECLRDRMRKLRHEQSSKAQK